MTLEEIGCCGAYCKPCLERQKKNNTNEKLCRGCKLGYASGERNINRTRCKVKICCFKERKLQTCADCVDYPCDNLQAFYGRKRYAGKRYQESIEFIRKNGYDDFLKIADKWKGLYGKLKIERS
jgi:hypothetical protein